MYADPDVRRWHARTLEDDDEARQLVAGWTGEWGARTGAHLAVDDDDGALVGRVSLVDVDGRDGTAEIGYCTAPDARGRGVATAAVEAVVGWAKAGGLRRLEIEHAVGDAASCRVAARSGFALEGVEPDAPVLVAEAGGAVLGYLLAQLQPTFFADAPVAWVQEVVVAADRRGTGGVGRALVRAVEAWAAECGAAYVSLASRRAGDFYRAIGYDASATFYRRAVEGA